MRRPVVPFLTPPDSAVSQGGWLWRSPERDVELPREMPHWDYQRRLEFVAPVFVDRLAITEACDLEWSSRLAVIVMARSNHTNIEVLAATAEVPMARTFDLALNIALPGDNLGGRLTLETLLVVTEAKPLSRLAARTQGSILWRTSHWTDLEGVGTQFPTDTADFRAIGLDANAAWQLKIDHSDPDAKFMSAARLTLNSASPPVAKLLDGAKDPGTSQLLRTLNWDVTRLMVQTALQIEDIDSYEPDPDATSLAGVLRNLLSRLWPGVSPKTLRQWQAEDPARIELRLQHVSKLVA